MSVQNLASILYTLCIKDAFSNISISLRKIRQYFKTWWVS